MNVFRPSLLVLALLACSPAAASDAGGKPGKGLQEIPDAELGGMRGRYTVGGNAVAWFGVSMISTWQTADGQRLQGMLTLGMDFTKGGAPRVSFTPTVSITAADAALPDTHTSGREIDASGLANVGGLVQSIQLAGDGNRASNVLQLNVRDGGDAHEFGAEGASSASTVGGGASATASFNGNAASIDLQIAGQGAVQQWLRSGSVGQSIQLMADGHDVGNRLQIDLVRQSVQANVPLVQNVAQAITLARGTGTMAGQ